MIMKSISKIWFFTVLFLSAGFVQAQNKQYAYINAQELIQVMPEYNLAMDSLQAYQDDLQSTFETLQQEYTTKLTDYQNNVDTYSTTMLQTKQQELMDMQQRLQTFSDNADPQMTTRQNQLMAPIYTKVTDAIQAVAEEQGVIYVIDATALLYTSPDGFDLLPLVKAKLGIQ